MKKILFSLPAESLATRWASSFIKMNVVYTHLSAYRQYLVRRFSRRKLFELRAPQSDVIIATGHGAADRIAGQKDIILAIDEYSDEEVSGKKIYLLSCMAGQDLAPDLIKKGAKVVYGYSEDFVALINTKYFLTPFNDPAAGDFFKPACTGMKMLVDGNENYKQIADKQREEFLRNAERVRTEDPEMAALLSHNADALVCYTVDGKCS